MIKYSPSILVHNVVSFTDILDPKVFTGIRDDYTNTPRESLNTADVGDPEFKKLYFSLHSHKAREHLRAKHSYLCRQIAQGWYY